MTTKRLKVGVVGASMSNSPDGRERFAVRAHIPALLALPELYEVVATCTTRMETAQNSARRFNIPHAYDSIDRMLKESPDIDVVCISVNPASQHSTVMAALKAGKHVYCEHPMGTTTAQAEEMCRVAKEKNLRTVVGHEYHYEPAVLQMAQMVREGYIGKPLAFNISYCTSSYIAPRPSHRKWLFDSEKGGHPGYRSGHLLDRLTSVLGTDVTDICADMTVQVSERANLDGGAPIKNNQVDNLNYLLRVGNGITGTLQVCLTAWFGPGWGFELYGSEGMLMLAVRDSGSKDTVKGDPDSGDLRLFGARVDIDKLVANPTAPELLQRQHKEITPAAHHYYVKGIDYGRSTFPVAQTWYAFAQAINNGTECAPSFYDKAKMHRVWDATEKSMQDRSWIKVDYSGLAGS